jgi:surface protein
MKITFGSLAILSFLLLSCSSHGGSASDSEEKPQPGLPDVEDNQNHETDILTAENSEITLYYDTPRAMRLFYLKDTPLKVVKGNNCVEILTESPVTNSNGVARLEMKARLYNCEAGKKVTVCLAQNEEMCTDFTVRTTTDADIIDTNHNLMIDAYETNTDKDKFANYVPGDCNSFCSDHSDCLDFCDSAIGYRCSTRCTSDPQCIKYEDDDGNWIQMVCRGDGRCAYPEFKAVYDINKDNTTLTIGGQPAEENVTIDWGDGTIETISPMTNNDLSHTYAKSGQYTMVIKGDYRNWTAGCTNEVKEVNEKTVITPIISLYDIQQFGQIGLGYVGNREDVDQGSFTNCHTFNRMTAKDIPDSDKLTDMSSMFAGNAPGVHTLFDNPAITRWDTSNVKSMFHTFLNSGVYHQSLNTGISQDIGRWNTSKVTTMNGLFNSSPRFNQNISCWDMSSVTDISYMFLYNVSFNQDLSNWDLHNVTQHNCMFRFENGHNGAISLKNYCKLRSRVNNENIGRDGDRSDKVYGDCPGVYNKFKTDQNDPFYSTCCGNGGGLRPEDRGKYENLCSPGYDYGTSCDNGTWQEIVHKCLDRYLHLQDAYKHLNEENTTCAHLRTARDCYYECHKCYRECHEQNLETCECDRIYYDLEQFWCTCQGMDD